MEGSLSNQLPESASISVGLGVEDVNSCQCGDPAKHGGHFISDPDMSAEGIKIDRAALKTVSPYITRNLKRYGDYVVDFKQIPLPLEDAIPLPIQLTAQQLE